MKMCDVCRHEKPLDQYRSLNVDRPGETSSCLSCRRRKHLRKHTRPDGRGGKAICGIPTCTQRTTYGSPLCPAHGSLPLSSAYRTWYALSCLTCGGLEYYGLTQDERRRAVYASCPRCHGFRELNEDRQGAGGPGGAHVTMS